jgi:hypothetical protein
MDAEVELLTIAPQTPSFELLEEGMLLETETFIEDPEHVIFTFILSLLKLVELGVGVGVGEGVGVGVEEVEFEEVLLLLVELLEELVVLAEGVGVDVGLGVTDGLTLFKDAVAEGVAVLSWALWEASCSFGFAGLF